MHTHLPVIIDVEASGFGATSYPIEVGFALEDGSRHCTLIQPAEGWDFWDDGAEAVHHISRETLTKYGTSPQQVADELNRQLSGKRVFTDGWVVDKPWLNKLFYTARRSMMFEVSPLELILREPQMDEWHCVKEQIVDELQLDRHRASNDALIIQETYRRTYDNMHRLRSAAG